MIVHLSRDSGALMIPKGTYHRSVSGINGSVVINQAIRDDLFQSEKEFEPVVRSSKSSKKTKNLKGIKTQTPHKERGLDSISEENSFV